MKIAVFLPNWIGDAVMAIPAVRALRSHFADSQIFGVLKPYIAGVLEGSAWFDALVFLDKSGPWSQSLLGAAARLRSARVDLAVLFSNSFRSALIARLGGCRRRVGYARHARGWLLTDRVEPFRGESGRLLPSPIIDAYNLLAQTVGCPRPSYRLELFTTPPDEQLAERVWQETGLERFDEIVCLNPGAAFGAAKFWPREYFVALAQQFSDQRGSGVLVLCGPGERDLARQIAVEAKRPGVHALSDFPLSIGLTKACIRRCDLLVTTDSGPRHFATAFDRPTITLFGPTHIAWTETYHAKAIHLQKKVECGPCQRRVCPLDHRCMIQLTPAEVFVAATELLLRYPGRRIAARVLSA
jgi:heptosyltransferase-2